MATRRPLSSRRKSKSGAILESAMREVHENVPSTVERAGVTGARRTAMLRAIAFSKARKAGARLPRAGRSRSK